MVQGHPRVTRNAGLVGGDPALCAPRREARTLWEADLWVSWLRVDPLPSWQGSACIFKTLMGPLKKNDSLLAH